jgi:NAD dependent epimerase/dehydratase
MFFNNRKVLVTGASGFIGSHLVQHLIEQGAHVRAMTHYRSDPSLHNLEFLSAEEKSSVELVKGNIEDTHFVRDVLRGCDTVFHLAALIGIPYSYIAPSSYISTNICGTYNILEACKIEGVRRIVHTSTSECYGTAKFTPMDENHPLQGQSPYSASKIGADKIAESYYHSFDLPVVTIRPFNTFGPRQSLRAVIPTIIVQLLAGVKFLKIGSRTPVRDFTFVSDTVEGMLRAAMSERAIGEVINLGVGKGITIGALAQKLMESIGTCTQFETENTRVRPEKSEVMALISNNTKAMELLNWTPKVTLEEGLIETINFFEHNFQSLRIQQYEV